MLRKIDRPFKWYSRLCAAVLSERRGRDDAKECKHELETGNELNQMAGPRYITRIRTRINGMNKIEETDCLI